MAKGRRTTLEERIEIVQDCISNGKDYGQAVEKHRVSYQQAYTWVRKYEEDGIGSLMDRRGKRKDESAMTEVEKTPGRTEDHAGQIEKGRNRERTVKKSGGDRKEAGLSGVRQENRYLAIKLLHEEKYYAIDLLCEIAEIQRSAYYKWLCRAESRRERENRNLADRIAAVHNDFPELGYRRMRDVLIRDYDTHVSDNHVLRIMRVLGIQSTVKFQRNGCTRSASDPQYVAENILKRDFRADKPNEKWLTDVTEFKYIQENEVHKIYLSAILDLCDKRVVSSMIGDRNNNPLVFSTFDAAVAAYPDAHPLFHSDRGFQYTSRIFHQKLVDAGMAQSMSRVAHCIDNGPMEGFWGIMKREMYYGRKYYDRETLVKAIEDYLDYYNNRRYQRKLMTLTPMEAYRTLLAA